MKHLVAWPFRPGQRHRWNLSDSLQWICVLTIMTITLMSTVLCLYNTLPNKLYVMWLKCQQSPPWTAPFPLWIKICNATANNSQAVCLANRMCCFQQITHLLIDKDKSTRIDQVLIKSSPHSYQGRDLPFPESCPSTSLMDLQREVAERNIINQ